MARSQGRGSSKDGHREGHDGESAAASADAQRKAFYQACVQVERFFSTVFHQDYRSTDGSEETALQDFFRREGKPELLRAIHWGIKSLNALGLQEQQLAEFLLRVNCYHVPDSARAWLHQLQERFELEIALRQSTQGL